jgi:hypothetical protein
MNNKGTVDKTVLPENVEQRKNHTIELEKCLKASRF